MTDLDPARQSLPTRSVVDRLVRIRRIADSRRQGDEDGARTALGNDVSLPPAFMVGTSLEHLARIALG